jgi:hypothetical protein
MIKRIGSTYGRGWLAGPMVFGLGLAVTGCGGGPTPPPAKSENTAPAPAEKAPAPKKAKSAFKGRGQQMSPGGDMGVRERRAMKLKEREDAAAKQQ